MTAGEVFPCRNQSFNPDSLLTFYLYVRMSLPNRSSSSSQFSTSYLKAFPSAELSK